MNIDTLSKSVATWVSVVAAIVAAIIGYLSFQQANAQRREDRIIQTFAFVDRLHSPEMMVIREKLDNEAWCDVYVGDTNPVAGEVEAAAVAIEPPAEERPELTRHEINSFIDMFDAVQICLDQNLCNRDFAAQLFGPYARSLYGELSQFILDERQRRDPGVGRGIETLSGDERNVEQRATAYLTDQCGVTPTPPPSEASPTEATP
ncbi:MAG: hypothetical protein AB7O98_03180 [Hyphomonadaceae bacterium]